MSLLSHIGSLLTAKYGASDVSDAPEDVKKWFGIVEELLIDVETGYVDVSTDESIERDEEEADPLWVFQEENDESDDEFYSPDPKKIRFGGRLVDTDEVNKAVEFRKKLDGATRRETIRNIKDTLHEWVMSKLNQGISLHDIDLRHRALKINASCYALPNFKASSTFIANFKKENRLCSRKVTKFVAKKSVRDKQKLQEDAKKFVDSIKDLISTENIPLEAIFNADQSGFQKEMHGQRSLAEVGQKSVIRVVDSVAATTHSSTVLPQTSPAGFLRPKFCVVMQEPGGKFPAKGHFESDNLIVYANSTHIMTKSLMFNWLKDCVFTNDMPTVMLLILDSWPPFLDHAEIQKLVPAGKKLFIKNIPPGTTSMVQPLDVFFFAVFKRFMKRITTHVQVEEIPFKIHARDNILKVLSQVYWIFCHPRFADFLRYSWYAAGYISVRPPNFQTPIQFCFNFDSSQCLLCNDTPFLKCPYCEDLFCFSDYFDNLHRC